MPGPGRPLPPDRARWHGHAPTTLRAAVPRAAPAATKTPGNEKRGSWMEGRGRILSQAKSARHKRFGWLARFMWESNGGPGGARTPNPQFRRLMLYPIELQGRWEGQENLGWETGIEPATVGATVRCSTS